MFYPILGIVIYCSLQKAPPKLSLQAHRLLTDHATRHAMLIFPEPSSGRQASAAGDLSETEAPFPTGPGGRWGGRGSGARKRREAEGRHSWMKRSEQVMYTK